MKISSVNIYKAPIPLKEPFKISLGILTHAENVIVRVNTDEGITGTGECSPFPMINGETMDTAFIVAGCLTSVLKGQDPLDIEGCTRLMDAVIYGNSSIKSAFDIALYDIAARAAGMPIYQFLGGKKNKDIITDYTVSIDEPGKMANDAEKIMAKGFRIIKVKLGKQEQDLERIAAIRERVGMEVLVRIDANQGWEPADAIRMLKSLGPYRVQYCEEPIARWNYMELPGIRKHSPIKIMADESCCDHHDANRLIALGACDYLNIKLGKSGGIFNALKIFHLAEQAGMKMQLGGFLESRLAFTAAAHLAFVSECVSYFDFDTPLMFVKDHIKGGIAYHANGVISVPDEPGLGVIVDEAFLRELITKTV